MTPEPTQETTTKHPRTQVLFKSKKVSTMVTVLLFVGLAAVAAFFGWKYYTLANSKSAAEKEVQDLVKKVDKLFDLPDGEVPSLATVSDKEKVKNQPFFSRAENGDKVLFYTQLGRAILYRPSTDKVIDVTIIKQTDQANGSGSAQPQ